MDELGAAPQNPKRPMGWNRRRKGGGERVEERQTGTDREPNPLPEHFPFRGYTLLTLCAAVCEAARVGGVGGAYSVPSIGGCSIAIG